MCILQARTRIHTHNKNKQAKNVQLKCKWKLMVPHNRISNLHFNITWSSCSTGAITNKEFHIHCGVINPTHHFLMWMVNYDETSHTMTNYFRQWTKLLTKSLVTFTSEQNLTESVIAANNELYWSTHEASLQPYHSSSFIPCSTAKKCHTEADAQPYLFSLTFLLASTMNSES